MRAPLTAPSPGPARTALRAAFEARDLDAIVAALDPEVLVHSPITHRIKFRGVAEARTLFETALDVLEDVTYTEEFVEDGVQILCSRVAFGDHVGEMTIRLRLGEEGLVRELTVYMRPLFTLMAFAASLVPSLARRRGRGRAFAAWLLTAPLARLAYWGDRLFATRLVEGTPAEPPQRSRAAR